MATLRDRMAALADRTVANNRWRQHRCVNLIPSEQTPSLITKLFEIADPSGRYAEHRTHKGNEVYYYQGIGFIREVEEECRKEMSEYFGCPEVELRPISGQMSNEVVFKAMLKHIARIRPSATRMRHVMNNDLTKGGHLSAQPLGALFNFVDTDPETGKEAVTNFPLNPTNPYRPDVDRLLTMLADARPDLVIFGKSMFLYPEPVKEVAAAVSSWEERPVLMFDMAHVLGLYGAFQAPFDDGADVVTGSTHKTFFGPQRGVVAMNLPKGHPHRRLAADIKSRAFPGSTSNHHLGTLLGLLASAYEMNAFRADYQSAVRRNAKAFAVALANAGVHVEGDPADSYTETHQVIARVSDHGTGEEVADRLEANHLIVNYQALPDDASFAGTSGIRIGVQEMTRFGMGEKDFAELAPLMARVILEKETLGPEVEAFRARFRTMRYCLDAEESADIGSGLLASLFPHSEYGERFADNLTKLARLLPA